jgi:hypothetical protein
MKSTPIWSAEGRFKRIYRHRHVTHFALHDMRALHGNRMLRRSLLSRAGRPNDSSTHHICMIK